METTRLCCLTSFLFRVYYVLTVSGNDMSTLDVEGSTLGGGSFSGGGTDETPKDLDHLHPSLFLYLHPPILTLYE